MGQAQANLLDQTQSSQKTFKDKLKLTMSGLSGAFMMPIATLAITSIFLVIGGLIESSFSDQLAIQRIGTFIKSIAYPILQAIPLLFCVAFTYSFCKGDLVCIWCAIIAYLTFLSVQGVFIYSDSSSSLDSNASHTHSVVVMFKGPGRDPKLMTNLVDKTLGFTALNTSIFGPFLLGGVVMPFIQRHFFNVNLKGPFAFFSGKRFVPLVSVVFSAALAVYFLVLWPWVGTLFSYIGNSLSKTPYGIDSFIFGLLEKSLIPVGLHHMFYAPLWFSPLGGDAVSAINALVNSCPNGENTSCYTSNTVFTQDLIRLPTSSAAAIWNVHGGARVPHSMWQGDSFLGASIVSLPTNTINGTPVFEYFKQTLGINVGRYTQGKYAVMQFGLPFAAVGMSLATDNPRETIKNFIPGILSSFLLGITEPLEFTFLFSAPKLFYGFHAVMCGFSFMLMNLMGAHIPSIFSGGFVEFILLGVIPVAKGTLFYTYFFVGMILAPLYAWVFYISVKKFGLVVPGTGDKQEVESITESKVPEKTRKLALALGGWSNIEKMANCASRLRYDIVDKSKVDEAAMKAAGVIAVKWVGDNHLQAIVGPQAEGINNEMIKWKGEKL